jgi:hypothetical protein
MQIIILSDDYRQMLKILAFVIGLHTSTNKVSRVQSSLD